MRENVPPHDEGTEGAGDAAAGVGEEEEEEEDEEGALVEFGATGGW